MSRLTKKNRRPTKHKFREMVVSTPSTNFYTSLPQPDKIIVEGYLQMIDIITKPFNIRISIR